MPSTPPWRYGVALFPVPVLASVAAAVGFRLFTLNSIDAPTTDAGILSVLAVFGLSAFVSLAGVAVALVLDAHALRRSDAGFAPRPAFAGAVGVVHLLASALLAPLYVLSVPSLAYYTYWRFGPR